MTEQEGFIEAITDRDRALKGLTDEIEIMRYEVEAVLAIKVERDALATTLAAIEIKVDALIVERDAYAAAADTMAAAHKVERDALKDAAKLALDALVDLKGIRMNEVEHLSVLRATNALKAVL